MPAAAAAASVVGGNGSTPGSSEGQKGNHLNGGPLLML
jgi:hypothetical protein